MAFERSYASALREHVESANGDGAGAGERIGRRARSLGVDTLALARIHDRSTAELTPPGTAAGRRAAARAADFFAEAVSPLEEEHCGASETLAETARLAAALERSKDELVAARAGLAREAERRRAVQAELDRSKRYGGECRARSRHAEERLRRISRRLLGAQEEDRLRISRDLHDAISQTLTGINVGLATLKNEAASDSRELAAAISTTQALVERSMQTVHRFAWELRPTLLDDLGLVPALRSYAKAFAGRTGVKVRVAAGGPGISRLDGDGRIALFRVAQGALLNVERHARAGLVRIALKTLPGAVRLEVADDGRSFDLARLEASRSGRHLGLIVMRERVEMIGGTFAIDASPGRGTTVRAEIPLKAATRE